MAFAPRPTRWIACVDGTWGTPDGTYGNRHGNISNIYRICASVKVGGCVDESSGLIYNQQKKYYNGLGSEKDIIFLQRLEIGAFGIGFQKQIREDCCMLPDHPQNEIWLFGFSRGAYVVRAVAGLLHHCRALTSAHTPEFEKHFEDVLQMYRSKIRGKSKHEEVGQAHHLLASRTREAPRIQFVGVLDTVKAVNDGSLYEISFNDSIQHLRHALALNENRRAFKPECCFPDYEHIPLTGRSIVQAWFVGAHVDVGGSAAKDGLALYPLQWMLIESRAKGLRLEFDGSFGNRADIDDPLKIIFPSYESETFKIKNGLEIAMQDIRQVHAIHLNQSKNIQKSNYTIHINHSKGIWLSKEPRAVFNQDGTLKGYCKNPAQGTILHPSVYLLFDEYSNVFLDSKALSFRGKIEELRSTILTETTFWSERETINFEEPGTIRILVCGNSGVGKSTLINKVFGAELTTASDRAGGIHDIRIPIICQDRPDLKIHDSCGFEYGGNKEFQQVKEFITEMSKVTEMKNRLHVIWFCVEVNSPRNYQQAVVKFFTTVSQNPDIPIVIVLTKKDEFWNQQYGSKAREGSTDVADLEAYADEKLRERITLIETELLDIKDGRCDSIVAVSKDDENSIKMVTEETARCFDHEKVRMSYIAAQRAHIDLKVDLAVTKMMQIYKHTIVSTGLVSAIPLGGSVNRVTVAAVVCKAILNAFGVRSVTANTVQQIIKNVIWDDMGRNFSVFIADCIAAVGILGTILSGGIPVFLIANAVNAPINILATTSLMLMHSCDIILILGRAFKSCKCQHRSQPLKKDIQNASEAYVPFARQVHQEVQELIPKANLIKTFWTTEITIGVEKILDRYTKLFIEQSEAQEGSDHGSEYSRISSIEYEKTQNVWSNV